MDKILIAAALVETVGWIWLFTTWYMAAGFIFTPIALIVCGGFVGGMRLLEMYQEKSLDED